jgi:hypothetical protein
VFVRGEPERAPNTRGTGSGFIKKIQNVKTVVAEGKISHGRSEDSNDDENFITPPSSPAAKRVSLHQCVVQSPDSQIPLKNVKHCNTLPYNNYIFLLLQMKLQDDESEGSTLEFEARATEDSGLFIGVCFIVSCNYAFLS